jgi:hypothetical protein
LAKRQTKNAENTPSDPSGLVPLNNRVTKIIRIVFPVPLCLRGTGLYPARIKAEEVIFPPSYLA